MEIFTFESMSALLTLTVLEIVLGIDNIVFIAILCGKLEQKLQNKARLIGLSLAMITRILLLFAITWVMELTKPVLLGFSGRDLILLGGGLFLIWKATHEIHAKIDGDEHEKEVGQKKVSFNSVIFQILMIDIIFSLDSVITAVGIADQLWVMVTAVMISVVIMMVFSGAITRFINKHPTFKMLALSFLILVGVLLVSEAFGKHVERGYVYFAMAFSFLVELLNTKERTNRTKKKPSAA